jgi:hypothetical protein
MGGNSFDITCGMLDILKLFVACESYRKKMVACQTFAVIIIGRLKANLLVRLQGYPQSFYVSP